MVRLGLVPFSRFFPNIHQFEGVRHKNGSCATQQPPISWTAWSLLSPAPSFTGVLSKQTEGKGNLASNKNKLVQKYSLKYFLGPRGPLVLPLVDPSVCPSLLKIWTPIYRHICLMNHQETHQTNPVQSSTTHYSLVPPSTV